MTTPNASSTSSDHGGKDAGAGGPEESKDVEAQTVVEQGKRKKLELQDQTNLLPHRQVLIVFAGLSMALFCSSLNQTM
jgi:hypothetical protein